MKWHILFIDNPVSEFGQLLFQHFCQFVGEGVAHQAA